jgi:hypothetical protein
VQPSGRIRHLQTLDLRIHTRFLNTPAPDGTLAARGAERAFLERRCHHDRLSLARRHRDRRSARRRSVAADARPALRRDRLVDRRGLAVAHPRALGGARRRARDRRPDSVPALARSARLRHRATGRRVLRRDRPPGLARCSRRARVHANRGTPRERFLYRIPADRRGRDRYHPHRRPPRALPVSRRALARRRALVVGFGIGADWLFFLDAAQWIAESAGVGEP